MAGKQKIDFLDKTPDQGPKRTKRVNQIFTNVYGCRTEQGQGVKTGKYMLKVFCAEVVVDWPTLLEDINSKLVIGTASENQYVPGKSQLMISIYSKAQFEKVKPIIVDALNAQGVHTCNELKPMALAKKDPDNEPPEKITLSLTENDRGILELRGESFAIRTHLLKMGGTWDADGHKVIFDEATEGHMTNDWIRENLQELCDLCACDLVHAWYPEPVPHINLSLPQSLTPDCPSPTLSELIALENIITYEQELNDAWVEEQRELDMCRDPTWPLLSVVRVLKESEAMGASDVERRAELKRLLLDHEYWDRWCVDSTWLYHPGMPENDM